MARELSSDELKRLARLGAQVRLGELEEERRNILGAFPGLTVVIARRKPAKDAPERSTADTGKKTRKRRRKMTAAEKKAASERMKGYWAARKQG